MTTYAHAATVSGDRLLVQVVLRGGVVGRLREHARGMIVALAECSPIPVNRAKVILTRTTHSDDAQRVVAEVNLDLGWRTIRAQVAASSTFEALDVARERLRSKLDVLSRDPSGRHGWARVHRPAYAFPPVAERQVVQQTTYEPEKSTVDQAALDMELMDYDFHMFVDADSGVDSVIWRGAPDYRVITLDAAPRLTVSRALDSLNITNEPFLYFEDELSGRGLVVYRRYDGHYGIITPSRNSLR